MITLYPHQEEVLVKTENFNKTAHYLDMGLGKTFTGAEKLHRLGNDTNLVVCQKSKIDDWINHFSLYPYEVYNLRDQLDEFLRSSNPKVGVINYELTYRRPLNLINHTILLDESSLIQNPSTKRTKFILNSKHKNIILLSGTPTAGKYEQLMTQIKLLGWNISEDLFWDHYIDWVWEENHEGYFDKKILGYKNIDRLIYKLNQHGAIFLKSEDVPEISLPKKVTSYMGVDTTPEYKKFMKDRIIEIDDRLLIGDHGLTHRLYARLLCSIYNKNKLEAFMDLVNSTEDRLIVFYNFVKEFEVLRDLTTRPVSYVNGLGSDLNNYHKHDNSITLCQYQAGSMGIDLWKANKMIFFTPPESCEFFIQSPKRIHRIGQEADRCFYYYLLCKDSVEEHMIDNLKRGRDYTDKLFGQL